MHLYAQTLSWLPAAPMIHPIRSAILIVPLFALGCGDRFAGAAAPLGSSATALITSQGQQLQGQQLQGASLAGGPATSAPALVHRYDGWIAGRRRLSARIIQGQLSAQDDHGRTLSDAGLIGVLVPADQGATRVWTVIRDVKPDPTFPEGGTSLYSIDVVAADGSTSPLCRPDASGTAAAIPIAALFDDHGDRVESTAQFTFSCTAGVMAKCYRWGYRPWLQGAVPSQEFTDLHQACTRMARADYCGNGQTWTHDGTLINLWDHAPAPGPFQDHGTPPPDFVFEAGWSTKGAVCLSKQRWATLPPEIAASCPDRLIAPGVSTAAGSVCDTEGEAVLFDASTQLFNESKLNVK